MTIPRLAWPLAVDTNTGGLHVVEQDSDTDIEQCVRAILLHRPGDRPDQPDLGILDPALTELPLPIAEITETIRQHEPRVDVLLEAHEDAIDHAIIDITVGWQRTETEETA